MQKNNQFNDNLADVGGYVIHTADTPPRSVLIEIAPEPNQVCDVWLTNSNRVTLDARAVVQVTAALQQMMRRKGKAADPVELRPTLADAVSSEDVITGILANAIEESEKVQVFGATATSVGDYKIDQGGVVIARAANAADARNIVNALKLQEYVVWRRSGLKLEPTPLPSADEESAFLSLLDEIDRDKASELAMLERLLGETESIGLISERAHHVYNRVLDRVMILRAEVGK